MPCRAHLPSRRAPNAEAMAKSAHRAGGSLPRDIFSLNSPSTLLIDNHHHKRRQGSTCAPLIDNHFPGAWKGIRMPFFSLRPDHNVHQGGCLLSGSPPFQDKKTLHNKQVIDMSIPCRAASPHDSAPHHTNGPPSDHFSRHRNCNLPFVCRLLSGRAVIGP